MNVVIVAGAGAVVLIGTLHAVYTFRAAAPWWLLLSLGGTTKRRVILQSAPYWFPETVIGVVLGSSRLLAAALVYVVGIR